MKKQMESVAGEKNKNQLSVLLWNCACATGDAEVSERSARILTSAAFEFSGLHSFQLRACNEAQSLCYESLRTFFDFKFLCVCLSMEVIAS
jgi:hypothetical protein